MVVHSRLSLTLFFAVLGAICFTAAASGAVFVVTKTTDDNGSCTPADCALREAVIEANALPGADTVEVPAGVYPLTISGSGETGGSLDVTDDVEIYGVPGETTIIGDQEGVLLVQGQFGVSETRAVISGLHITGGHAEFGGGIRLSLADVVIVDSLIEGNTATIDGGGIYAALGSLTVTRSSVTNNHADDFGGGIGRRSVSAQSSTSVVVRNSTVSGNSAGLDGGALYSFGPGGELRIENSTLIDNGSGRSGALIFQEFSIGPEFLNSVLEGDCFFIGSQFPVSLGGNVGKDADFCFLDQTSDQDEVVDLGILPLGGYGGPTPTHALTQSSPAIDAALTADCPSQDQRGEPRPIDGDLDAQADCDSGAFELQLGSSPVAIPSLGTLGRITFCLALSLCGLLALRC